MTTQGTPPGAVPGMPSGDAGAAPGNPFGAQQLLVDGPGRQEPRDLSNLPSPQSLGRRAAVWLGKDAEGNEISGEGDPFAQATEASQKKASKGPLRFQTSGGRSVLPKNADESTLVLDSEGNTISDLGSLLQAGLIEADGLTYKLVGDQDAGPEVDQKVGPEDAAEAAARESAEKAAAQQVPFEDQQTEAFVQSIQQTQLYANLTELMSDPNFSGVVPSAVLESAAAELGVPTEQARATIAHIAAQFQQQAIRYISDAGIDPQNLMNWLKSDNGADKETKELLSKAMKAHSQGRSLEGYNAVVARFLATLARDHPEALMSQLEGVANIRKDPSTGAVLVDIPGMGETSFEVAARQGWLKTRRGGGRDGRGRYTTSQPQPFEEPSSFAPGWNRG
jgi:hypothetical protein